MREFQNAYYQDVGVSTGLTRIGPGRKRLSRVEWNSQKAEAQQIAKAYVATSEIVNEATLQGQSIVNEARQERIKLEQERRDFEVEQITFYEKRRELIAAVKKTKELQAQLDEEFQVLKTKSLELDGIRKFLEKKQLDQTNQLNAQYKSKITELGAQLKTINEAIELHDDFQTHLNLRLNGDLREVNNFYEENRDWTVGCDPTKNQSRQKTIDYPQSISIDY